MSKYKQLSEEIGYAVITSMRDFIRKGRLSQWDKADIAAVVEPILRKQEFTPIGTMTGRVVCGSPNVTTTEPKSGT